jgi:hypothetical protein
MANYRILSLDGGGAWAVLQAMALADLYGADTDGWEVLRKFDLVAANSGGSIVLGGLVERLTPGQIVALFKDEAKRKSVFAPCPRTVLQGLLDFGPRYSTAAKLDGLKALMPKSKERRLSSFGQEALPRLLIMGFDYDRERAVFFRSWQSLTTSRRVDKLDPTLPEAIHASTNAPVNYFDAPALVGECRFWDGAIGGYNAPVVPALVEALADRAQRADIRVLSIGTGNTFKPMARGTLGESPRLVLKRKPMPGLPLERLKQDVPKLAASILAEPPSSALLTAHVLLDQPLPEPRADGQGVEPVRDGTVVRLNPLVAPWRDGEHYAMKAPFTEQLFDQLYRLDMDAVQDEDFRLVVQLGELWLKDQARNQPVRMSSDTLACEIGHETYSEAKKAWLRMAGH